MSKGKSITLLTIVSILMALVLAMTFVRFSFGVKDYNSLLGAIELDYGMSGGVSYTLTLNENNEEEVGEEQVRAVVDELGKRLEELGYETYTIKTLKSTDEEVKDYDIRIELNQTETVDADISAATTYGELKFYGGIEQNPTSQILEGVKIVEDSQYMGVYQDGGHVISLVFTEEGRNALLSAMEGMDTFYLRIACGYDEHGDEISLFNPSSPFDGSLLANGNRELSLTSGTEAAARQMALQLKYGGIDYRYDISNNGVGIVSESHFGKDVALKLAVSIMTLVLCLIIVSIIVYKGLGVVSSLSMLLFILAEAWLLIGVPNIVVNMGSIVGIIGATVVCAFAINLLLQKIKSEFANSEKTAKAAISKGFKDVLLPTINLHVVAGVFAILLLIFTKGFLRGFAITFGIGIAVSLISSLVFTRMFNALIFPLPKNKEKFLRFKRAEKANGEV